MTGAMDLVFIGLTLSSSWGNGHATTYRALLRALDAQGHRVTFLERDVPWYASSRDLEEPDYCRLRYYESVDELRRSYRRNIAQADAVIVGSYVPEGPAVIDAVADIADGQFCFYDIDTPVTLAKLESGECEYLAPPQIPLFDIYFSFTGGPTLTRLKRQYRARRAEALYCAVDPDRYAPTGEPPKWDLGYLGTYSPDRQPTLERLLIEPARQMPERRFVVAGPQYPTSIRWPENVERIEHLPPAQHASFYSRQRYTLNVTRADMIAAGWSPSVRLFEAAACGTPVISDAWAGLESLFGGDIHVTTRSDDVVRILSNEEDIVGRRLGSGARERVLARHTAQHRARELVGYLASPVEARTRKAEKESAGTAA
ncbi:glycosyltransferase [Pseudaminobacter sp. 19-2017]|uniref:Glycosyltransferase n=1 Tax=Pseudaminobacter soli (ex Zhang et al. 2022) TaxID=2831468 RepID=A0A942DZ16_9HYPH|nr:glycosyltransferase [Pseudaminobacter soli]MBS3647550.1 glycosyltransferase [Pseudaminobacter soli]